jgi:predicted 3-demethylubiquinone-9 3-methyltransferase (glyoxalase superfamily)
MKISPFLWFDHQAEDAARFYTAIFKNSKIIAISRYPATGQEVHGKAAGSVMTVAFELNGQSITALNGGPLFNFNEAVSFQIECANQEEVDYFWERLSDGGDPEAQQCGWLRIDSASPGRSFQRSFLSCSTSRTPKNPNASFRH